MNADNWLRQGRTSRPADTLAVIDDQPTEVAWFRKGQSLGYLTVRIVASGDGSEDRTAQSSSNTGQVTIVAPVDTALRADDTLQAPGGVVYAISFVHPSQATKTSAKAFVVTQ